MKLEVNSLSFSYGNEPVIRDLSFGVKEGEFVALIGPSGSGKSTLFQLIGGLLKPASGDIRLNGRPVTGPRGHVAYMPQQPSLLPWRTVEANVRLGQQLGGGTPDREEVKRLLRGAGLEDAAGKYPHELSGGMQQRVAFIRALAGRKDPLLLDEPFGALDALTRTRMQQWLLSMLQAERRTVLFITHSIDEALLLADRILVLSHRPMSLVREISVPFPRSDRFRLRGSADWFGLHREIENLLLPEPPDMPSP
ncbi:ABC transporter ATP-binding protein [Staphylospora marina]|uniref:ABC transporter ATP-binding protein n=1 Tax=Staphylospora marina TaxID=2490858 RepID=UPI000F5BBEDA|nr:ABC transporter ATP-binding protein [Staphylospora marina]